ncbi:MAG: hypothetical protein Q8865_04825 [Bacillota bacterium]|nr:hypothetical protein [Bacillota bacterium]
MENKSYKPLDMSKVNKKNSIVASSKKALSDVKPLDLSHDVRLGKNKIIVK